MHSKPNLYLYIFFSWVFIIKFCFAQDNLKDGKEWKELNLGLIEASREGQLEKVKLLLKKGAVISTRNRFGNTALHYAARNGHMNVLKVLLYGDMVAL